MASRDLYRPPIVVSFPTGPSLFTEEPHRTEHWLFLREMLGHDPAGPVPESVQRERREFLAAIAGRSVLEWDPAQHPRLGGPPNAGWFASTDGGTSGGRIHYPLDHENNADPSRLIGTGQTVVPHTGNAGNIAMPSIGHSGISAQSDNYARVPDHILAQVTRSLKPRSVSEEDVDRSRRQLDQAGLSHHERELRIKVLANNYHKTIAFPVPRSKHSGGYRNPAYWVENQKNRYITRPGIKPIDAINDLFKSEGNTIFCNKLSKLVLIKAVIDSAPASEHDKINRLLAGQEIPGDVAGSGSTTFYNEESKMEGEGFRLDELQPGDQIWIKNPYWDRSSPAEQSRHPGEEGSNLFYFGKDAEGNGLVMGLYDKKLRTLREYQEQMRSSWGTVRKFSNRKATDFKIRERNRAIPWK